MRIVLFHALAVSISISTRLADDATTGCDDYPGDPNIAETIIFTRYGETHCFLRSSNESLASIGEYTSNGKFFKFDKKKAEHRCQAYNAYLPQLTDGDLNEYMWKALWKPATTHAEILLGLTVKQVDKNAKIAKVLWDSGVEQDVNTDEIYGLRKRKWMYPEVGKVVVQWLGIWWSGGEKGNPHLICHQQRKGPFTTEKFFPWTEHRDWCKSGMDDDSIVEKFVYKTSDESHCFLRLSNETLPLMVTYENDTFTLNKQKVQEICYKYHAYLPQLTDGDLNDFFGRRPLQNGDTAVFEILLGVTVHDGIAHVTWDNGLKQEINTTDIHGQKRYWFYPVADRMVTLWVKEWTSAPKKRPRPKKPQLFCHQSEHRPVIHTTTISTTSTQTTSMLAKTNFQTSTNTNAKTTNNKSTPSITPKSNCISNFRSASSGVWVSILAGSVLFSWKSI